MLEILLSPTPALLDMSPIQFVAMITVLLQVWYYGKMKIVGPMFGMVGCALWILIGIHAGGMMGLVILNVLLFALNVKNFFAWRNKSKLIADAAAA